MPIRLLIDARLLHEEYSCEFPTREDGFCVNSQCSQLLHALKGKPSFHVALEGRMLIQPKTMHSRLIQAMKILLTVATGTFNLSARCASSEPPWSCVGTNAAADVPTPGLGSAAWLVAYGLVETDSADERTIKTRVE
jgi:hypothetical protein